MGLLSGGLNGRRFRVTSELPAGFRETFSAAIRDGAMTTDLTVSDELPRVGWVHAFDHAATDFELNDYLFDHYLVLTMRIDKKAVNGRFFKIALAEKIAAVTEERGSVPTKDDVENIEEALKAELHRKALPGVSTCDVAWDINTGEVTVFATSDTTINLITDLFQDTFGVTLRPERNVDWLTDKFDRTEVVERASSYLLDARGGQGTGVPMDGYHPDDPLEGALRGLAVDFITWLWLQGESTDGHFRVLDDDKPTPTVVEDVDDDWNDITETLKHAQLLLWLEGRLKLADLSDSDKRESTLIVAEAPTASTAARLDVQAGKQPVEATLGMAIGEVECKLSLVASEAGVLVSGLKLPFEVKRGQDEKIYERMGLLELVHGTLRKLYQQYFLARTSPAWNERIGSWIDQELAAK